MNILVTGSNGQLGSELRDISNNYSHNFFFTDKGILNILNIDKLKLFVFENKIDLIINASAYTAVDLAETNIDLAYEVNHLGVKNLVDVTKEFNIILIHISTDFVFDGINSLPYKEDNRVNPISIYGKSKLKGEEEILKENINSIIIRTSWLYSSHGKNFVKTILKLAKSKDQLNIIYDQIATPTYARDLAKTIFNLIPNLKNKRVEIYHYSNEGVASWYDFAKAIIEISKIECKINPIETKEYPTPATRPSYSILNKSKIKNKFNVEIPYWRDSLKECIMKIGDNYND